MSAPAAEPIAAAEFAAAMATLGPFEPTPHLAIAVSGGPDSLALAALAAAWLRQAGGRGTALTVDHGLRPAAAAEARWVADRVARLDLAHRTLRWHRVDGERATQAGARAARYRLLEDAAAELGCLHLLLGHHRDDNARTVAMRRRRGRGPGLAGMPAVRELDRVRLLRPLLAFPAVRLRATARRPGCGWIEDPSNRDPRFERSRIAGGPVDRGAIRDRLAREQAATRWLARHLGRTADRGVAFELAGWRAQPPDLAAEILARAAHAVGGIGYAPGRGRVVRAAAELVAGRGGLTLAGARVRRAGPRLVFEAEQPNLRPSKAGEERAKALAGAPFGAAHVVTDGAILIC